MRILANSGTAGSTLTTSNLQPGIRSSVRLFDPIANAFLGAPGNSPVQAYTGGVPVASEQRSQAEGVSRDPLVCRLRLILDRVDQLSTLPQNWDSYGSQPSAIPAVLAAKQLIWKVIASRYSHALDEAIPFSAVPLSGGGIQIEWRGSNGEIEVEIDPANSFSYLLTTHHGGNDETEERDNLSEEDITRLISSVTL